MSEEQETHDCNAGFSLPSPVPSGSCSSFSSSQAEGDVDGGEDTQKSDCNAHSDAETGGPDELTLAASAAAVLYGMAWWMENEQQFR